MENEKIVRTVVRVAQHPTEAHLQEIERAASMSVAPDACLQNCRPPFCSWQHKPPGASHIRRIRLNNVSLLHGNQLFLSI